MCSWCLHHPCESLLLFSTPPFSERRRKHLFRKRGTKCCRMQSIQAKSNEPKNLTGTSCYYSLFYNTTTCWYLRTASPIGFIWAIEFSKFPLFLKPVWEALWDCSTLRIHSRQKMWKHGVMTGSSKTSWQIGHVILLGASSARNDVVVSIAEESSMSLTRDFFR